MNSALLPVIDAAQHGVVSQTFELRPGALGNLLAAPGPWPRLDFGGMSSPTTHDWLAS